MSQAKEKKFLESYAGQTVDQLIAMESDYRIDSLVLAFEQAIEQKKETKKLSQAEVDILAVEAMEREVNNGGYHQFFLNSSKEHAAILPLSLERIGCPVAAKIASDALAYLKINGDITVAKIDAAFQHLGDKAIADLGKMDERYFQNKEPIADKLFAYIKAKRGEVALR
jgi:hypothetical protein